MSSFWATPVAIRSRGPLSGQAATSRTDQQQDTPAPAQQQSAFILPSTETPQAPEMERTPSPFIKEEPMDTRTYASFAVQNNDDDAYDPSELFTATATREPTLYDPAHTMLRRSTRLQVDRILSSKDGKTFEPPTICFSAPYRNKQLIHVLKCHGEVQTDKPRACGPNCQTTIYADMAVNGAPIDCTHPVCVDIREKRRASVFMPQRRMGRATPAARAASLQPKGPSTGPRAGGAMRRSQRLRTHDEHAAELNERVGNEPGFRELVESDAGGLMPKSKRHAGYAYTKELRENALAERLFKITDGLDISFDDKPMLKRETKNLHVDGTDKLRGIGGTFGHKRKAKDIEAEFAAHDRPVGAELDRDRPWSYANNWNLRRGQKAIRSEEAPMFSIPESRYKEMIAEENGVVVEQEDNRTHRLPRNQIDLGDEVDEEGRPTSYQTVEACHVCEVAGDGQLQECTGCHHHFHPVCAGTAGQLAESTTVPIWKYSCDGEGCQKALDEIRYKCFNVACQDRDYCFDCFHNGSAAHIQRMAEDGQDPSNHGFIAVRGEFADALVAEKDAAEYGFVCSSCRDAKYAQKVADQMFGKKNANVAEIQGQVNLEAKQRREALNQAGTFAAVKQRIADKQKSGISKPSTCQRRSGRIAGGGALGSVRQGSFKLKINPKQMAHLMTLNADSPEVIAAKAQLGTVPEEDEDVEMVDGEVEDVEEDAFDPELFGE